MSVPAIASPEWIHRYGLSSRAVCRRVQLELARVDDRVFSVEGDLAFPAVPFRDEFPQRFLQMGIAEADMVGVATGLAIRGKVPFVNTFAAFLALRACEAVRLAIMNHRPNFKLFGFGSGISAGVLANTHYCIEDLAVMRSIPDLVIMCPADSVETYKATWAAWRHEGPVYIRTGRVETPQVYFEDYEFTIGKAVRLVDGDDATVVATGNMMVYQAVRAAELLHADGVRCRVLNMHTVSPLDREAIITAAAETGALVTVEEHNRLGGLGGAVAETILRDTPAPVIRVGLRDRYCDPVGPYEEMLPAYGLEAAGIAEAVRSALRLKESWMRAASGQVGGHRQRGAELEQ